MENLKSLLKKLETSIEDLRVLSGSQQCYSSLPNLIFGGGALLSILVVLILPKWISVIIIAIYSWYVLRDRLKYNALIDQKLGEIRFVFNDINTSLDDIQAKINNCEDKISFLKSENENLQLLKIKETQAKEKTDASLGKTDAELHLDEILKKIQKLDIDIEEFGPECVQYIRKEFAKTLKVCGLEFIDYSEENQMLFATETAAINNIDCTARAIVTVTSPRKIVLKGHVFIPETRDNL